jgi:hypothetical protein
MHTSATWTLDAERLDLILHPGICNNIQRNDTSRNCIRPYKATFQLPTRLLSSIRNAAIRQLYAQHSDWSGWAGEPIHLSALQEVRFEIAADLAPTQQNSLKFFCISRANGVPGNRLPVIPNRK